MIVSVARPPGRARRSARRSQVYGSFTIGVSLSGARLVPCDDLAPREAVRAGRGSVALGDVRAEGAR